MIASFPKLAVRTLLVSVAVGVGRPGMPALAQTISQAATLSRVESAVFVADRSVPVQSAPMPLTGVAAVRTEAGRAVIELPHGARLLLDARTVVRLSNETGARPERPEGPGLRSVDQIRIVSGSAIVVNANPSTVVQCDLRPVQARSGAILKFTVQDTPGYSEPTCRLQVFEGTAAVRLLSLSTVLGQGKTMNIAYECGDMLPTNDFDWTSLDEFDRWARGAVMLPK